MQVKSRKKLKNKKNEKISKNYSYPQNFITEVMLTCFFLGIISCISWLLELAMSSEDGRDFFFFDFNRNEDLRDFDLVITGFSVDFVDKLRFRVWVLNSVIALFLVSRCLKSNFNQIQKIYIEVIPWLKKFWIPKSIMI